MRHKFTSGREVEAFAEVFYQKQNHTIRDQARLYSHIDPAVDRFKGLEEKNKDEFKKSLTAFVRVYSYLSQVLPFQDTNLEKLYSYGRFLLLKLPKTDYIERLKLDNEVALEYYRLQKINEGSIILQKQGEVGLSPTTEAGITKPKGEKARLSEIIDILNERFGTDFDQADKLFFDQIEEELFKDDLLKKQALNNDGARYVKITAPSFCPGLLFRCPKFPNIPLIIRLTKRSYQNG